MAASGGSSRPHSRRCAVVLCRSVSDFAAKRGCAKATSIVNACETELGSLPQHVADILQINVDRVSAQVQPRPRYAAS
jgi:hypothetical protein